MVKRTQSGRNWLGDSRLYWTLGAFLVLVFLTGGGSRSDIQSLVILRPVAIIICGMAMWTLTWQQVKNRRFLFLMAAALFALPLLHLIPLPPAIWHLLPGRTLIEEIDKAAGLGDIWRPISMVPSATWNAFYSLFVPLAVLLLGVQLSRADLFRLLPLILGLGLLSGFWGLLQTIGDPEGPLYLYRITSNGSAVGFFANRNHQAILIAMMFPMLAVYASAGIETYEKARFRGYVALAAGVVLIPLLLVTGSRAGLVVGIIGLLAAVGLYRRPTVTVPKKRVGKKLDLRWLLGVFAVILLGGLTIIMSRAEAFQRIAAPDQIEDLRFQMWPYIVDMAWKYFPIGSGIGSFVEVYQIDEPDILLSPTYVNHVHNDWLEVFMTAGLPGLLIVAIAFAGYLKASFAALFRGNSSRSELSFARLSVAVLAIMALGSVGDYPLRTPFLACIFVIALLWLAYQNDDQARASGVKDNWDGSFPSSGLANDGSE
jgi:O-antigen ligase